MGTKARPTQLRPAAAVRQWHAQEARRAARAARGRVPAGQRFTWPQDKAAIVAETMAAVRDRQAPALVPSAGEP